MAPPRGSRLTGFAAVPPRSALAFTFLSASGGSRPSFLSGGEPWPPDSPAGVFLSPGQSSSPAAAGWAEGGVGGLAFPRCYYLLGSLLLLLPSLLLLCAFLKEQG